MIQRLGVQIPAEVGEFFKKLVVHTANWQKFQLVKKKSPLSRLLLKQKKYIK